MPNSVPALLLPPQSEPLVLLAARTIAANLASGEPITRRQLYTLLTDHFGGTDADGRWSVRDAHIALELAQTEFLQANAQIDLTASAADADRMFTALESVLPTQTNRSDEQIEWQQFATPPRLAWLAARACALATDELVLEPSAGTGMLAVWAAKAGSRLDLNEISPLRRDCLSALFPAARVTGHDAELIDELLDPAIIPSVVLMNPPYSHGIERGHDSRTGSRHLRSAWNRLACGGRLVAIMPEWFDCAKFLAGLKEPISLRLNAAVERAFVRQGTGIATRLLVFDKVEGSNEPVAIRTNDFRQLVDLVDGLPARASLEAVTEQSSLPARAPFRLMAVPRRPLPTPARITPPASAIGSLTYRSLETPAPLAPQVGHYLPYTYHYLFGLLATTGLRISEALALQRDDVVSDGLIIRNGKFGKQRLLPIQPSTRAALDTYLNIRRRLNARGDDLFVTTRGCAPHRTVVHIVFVRLARKLGFRGPTGTPGIRVHDLRHTFAVRSLESCPRDREAIRHHMAALSTYLGHTDVANTYWYLEATPVLLRDIAAAGEQLFLGDAA